LRRISGRRDRVPKRQGENRRKELVKSGAEVLKAILSCSVEGFNPMKSLFFHSIMPGKTDGERSNEGQRKTAIEIQSVPLHQTASLPPLERIELKKKRWWQFWK